jgi:hypothetical protein
MTYQIKDPFGPSIYKSSLKEEQIKFLKKVAEDTRLKNISRGNKLAGNIQEQLTSEIKDKDYFINFIGDHVRTYAEHNINKYRNEFDGTHIELEDIDWQIAMPGPWINYQKKYEFNPIHSHTGIISAIIYIDIPEEIAKEKESIPIDSNTRCPGELGFVHADNGIMSNLHVTPTTGDIYLFQSTLNHTVYPFHSDAERISMSFNIDHLQTYQKDTT